MFHFGYLVLELLLAPRVLLCRIAGLGLYLLLADSLAHWAWGSTIASALGLTCLGIGLIWEWRAAD